MSFHFQRISNKLFKTKLPTSTYKSHYSFLAKRSLKDEVFVPNVKNEENREEVLSILKPVVWSNWRKPAKLESYRYPGEGEFWISLAMLLFGPCLYFINALNRRHTDVLSGEANTTMGIKDYQNNLDMSYED